MVIIARPAASAASSLLIAIWPEIPIVVNQVGSSSTVFRSSNEMTYFSPDYVPEMISSDDEEPTEETEESSED